MSTVILVLLVAQAQCTAYCFLDRQRGWTLIGVGDAIDIYLIDIRKTYSDIYGHKKAQTLVTYGLI